LGRDIGGGGLSPTKQIYAPPNEMKPISPFGIGLMFFHMLFPINCFTFDQWKEPATGGNFFPPRTMLAQTSAEITPPKPKILATSLNGWSSMQK